MPDHIDLTCRSEETSLARNELSLADDLLQSFSWGVNKSGLATLAIKSAHFGTYLRMDGRGPILPGAGGGVVNCQPFVGLWELFRIVPQNDGSVAIQSVSCGHWLRMDGSNVGEEGGGVVNCQSFVGYMEKFHLEPLDDAVAFRSVHYGTYLRMDAINAALQPISTGGGNVNCSKSIRSWERFKIEAIRPVVALKSWYSKLYLRVDCCHSNNKADGKISGQTYLGAWEKFILVRSEDGLVCLKSEAFHSFIYVVNSSGTLGVSDSLKTKFKMHFLPDGAVALECIQDQRPMYLSLSQAGVVSCEPSPIQDANRFTVIVDTS